jgi:hypothetical protein
MTFFDAAMTSRKDTSRFFHHLVKKIKFDCSKELGNKVVGNVT